MRRTGPFTINTDARLYQRGLKFALIGGSRSGNEARDRGPLRTLGTYSVLTGDSWIWDPWLGRQYLNKPAANGYLDFPLSPVLGTGPWSVAAWVWVTSGGGAFDGPICTWGDADTSHNYVELNCDNTGYFHADQAASGNSDTYLAALTTDAWNAILYQHPDNSPIASGALWVNGKAASGGGVGSTTLNITAGDSTLRIGESKSDDTFTITGRVTDLLIFDQPLGEPEAVLLANRADLSLGGLLVEDRATPYDLEPCR